MQARDRTASAIALKNVSVYICVYMILSDIEYDSEEVMEMMVCVYVYIYICIYAH